MLELRERAPDHERRAQGWFERACDRGHLRGCTALAELQLASDPDAPRELPLSLLQRACDGSDQRACARLSLVHGALGEARLCELAEGAKLADDALGQLAWARLAAAARCGVRDAAQIYRAFEAACNAGEVEGCFELAQRQLAESAPVRQHDRVRGWLRSACDGGIAAACVALADDFQAGKTGPQDPSLTRAALADACRLSDAAACGRLAAWIETTAPGDTSAARTAWEAACKLAQTHCFGLAVHLLDHPASEVDAPRIDAALRADCAAQHAAGCALLADIHGWRGAQSTLAQATKEFAKARHLLEVACSLHDADSCVKVALMLLNGEPETLERARSLLQTACEQSSQLGCAYLKQGPYPFPYPSRAAVPLRFALSSPPSTAQTERPPSVRQVGHVQEARPESTKPRSAREPERDATPLVSLRTTFDLAATSMAKVGSARWDLRASFGRGLGFSAVVPLYVASLQAVSDSGSAVGLGNPYLSLTYEPRYRAAQLRFQFGFTLPLAYVRHGDVDTGHATGDLGAQLGLQAAADSSGLDAAYLWIHNAAGGAGHASFETWRGPLFFGADASTALLWPMYSRSDVELFFALRGRLGLRVSRAWTCALSLALRDLTAAQQTRFAFEPELTYAADGGGTLGLGLSLVLWAKGESGLGDSPWVGLRLRISP
jgi:TPR repeat protein